MAMLVMSPFVSETANSDLYDSLKPNDRVTLLICFITESPGQVGRHEKGSASCTEAVLSWSCSTRYDKGCYVSSTDQRYTCGNENAI